MRISRRTMLGYGSMVAGLPLLSACGDEEKKIAGELNITPEQLAFSSGDETATVVMQEFLSLTCPHCATFHVKGFPLLKEKYIDPGKLLLVYRDFPLDGMALRAAMLVRALPPELGVKLQGVLLENQQTWARSDGDLTPLKNFARLAGFSPTQIDEVFADQEKMDVVVASRQLAVDQYGINATPSFVIGTDVFNGGSFEDIVEWAGSYIA